MYSPFKQYRNSYIWSIRAVWYTSWCGNGIYTYDRTNLFLLLRGLEESLQTAIPWVNTVLHYIMPITMLLDWILNPPNKKITWKKSCKLALIPVFYVVYSLLRGSIVNWYPYPFRSENRRIW